jgi:hypothetical protein
VHKRLTFCRVTESAYSFLLAPFVIVSVLLPSSALAACKWSNVPSGSADTSSGLFAASAISNNDAWAVGTGYFPDQGNSNQTLTEHWDGRRWKVVPSADTNSVEVLSGVAAISTNDVWAVGYQFYGGPEESLIEQWNGARWTIVPSPNPSDTVILSGVAAVSATDVWAVGFTQDASVNHTLTEHWNGSNWTVIPSPDATPGGSLLQSVSGASSNDVWAVGENSTKAGQLTLIEHWNGARWAVVPSPTSIQTFPENVLHGVAARSASDVWAVGSYRTLASPGQTLIEHWDGSSWKIVPSPNENVSGLQSVIANSASDAWAVGQRNTVRGYHTLTEHWDGVRWTKIATPDEISKKSGLFGLAAVGPNDILSVGYTGGSLLSNTLALQFHC